MSNSQRLQLRGSGGFAPPSRHQMEQLYIRTDLQCQSLRADARARLTLSMAPKRCLSIAHRSRIRILRQPFMYGVSSKRVIF
jgi:hypothetical protein